MVQDMEKEIWVLGSTGHDVDKCVTWYEAMPSFVDFDILIIDFNSMNEHFFKNKLSSIKDSFLEIEKRIENDGILICILSCNYYQETIVLGNSVIAPGEGTEVTRNMYYLLPIFPHLTKQTPSKVLKYQNNVFARDYYKNVETVSHVITDFKNGGRYSGLVALDEENQHIIGNTGVETKGRDLVSCSVKDYEGIIHFLPPTTKITSRDAIDILLEEIKIQYLGETKIPKRPPWMDKYICEDEKKIINDLTTLEKDYNKKKEDLKKKRQSFTEIDKIVWLCGDIGQGKHLEKAVKHFFENELGLNIKKTELGSHADLKGTYAGMKFAFEITGTKGAVSKQTKKVGQVMNYHLEKEENEKIVLIANTYCAKEISKRSKAEKDNFTDYVVNPLKSMNVCLVTTLQLFNLWRDMKDDKITKEKIIDKIYNTKGVLS